MNRIQLLDCTLRDGGYVNNWNFGENTIKGFGTEIGDTGIDIFEISFLRDEALDTNRAVYSNTSQMFDLFPKRKGLKYAAMIETGCLLPQNFVKKRTENTVDIIRFIMWKNKMDLAFEYCSELIKKGYDVFVQPTRVDQYTLDEFREMLLKMSQLSPEGIYIVDTFGTLTQQKLLSYIKIADETLPDNIALGYHAHNNLMQAEGNAELFLSYPTLREKLIDASVMGIGRGSGNLPLEIITDFLNTYYDKQYDTTRVLDLASKYIAPIQQKYTWGYNPWFFVTAKYECNPNYAIYFSNFKDISLVEFENIIKTMSKQERIRFTRETAKKYSNQNDV